MAIRYVDLVNGNDANNGTTYALRKKTISSATTGLTGGDTVRVMKSLDPTSLGTCTWPTNGRAITLPTAVTAHVNTCESGWTASANVTLAYTTTTTDVRQGTNAVSLGIATAFTTGKVAYAPCATTDLSGYQQISLFLRNTVAITANSIYLDLCSDATGDVPVVSFALPVKGSGTSYVAPITFDYGANLPNNIQSIAIRCATDPGIPTLIFDNIIACKDKTNADSLTLNSIIGLNTTNEPEWFPIKSIDGTTVTLDIWSLWCGSTGSLTTYKVEPIRQQDLQGAAGLLASNSTTQYPGWMSSVGGTQTAYLNIEFGWDTVDMSTQIGFTAVDAQVWSGSGIPNGAAGGYQFISVNKLITIRSNNLTSGSTNMKWGEIHSVSGAETRLSSGGVIEFDKLYLTSTKSTNTPVVAGSSIGNTYIYKHGPYYAANTQSWGFGGDIVEISNFITHGVSRFAFMNINRGHIINATIVANANVIANVFSGITGNNVSNFKIVNLNFIGPTNYFSSSIYANFNINIVNLTYNTAPATSPVIVAGYVAQNINIQNYNNTGEFRNYTDKFTMTSVTGAATRTGTGVAWQVIALSNIALSNTRTDWYTINNVWLGEVAVKANKLVTVTLWARRVFNTSQGCLFVKPFFPGITAPVVSYLTTTAQWEQLQIQFTPTINTVVPIYFGLQYDSVNATQNFRIDDFNITQAD